MRKSTCCRECANRKDGWRKCAADRDQCQRAPDVCNDVAEGMYTAPNKCFSCGDFEPIANAGGDGRPHAAGKDDGHEQQA